MGFPGHELRQYLLEAGPVDSTATPLQELGVHHRSTHHAVPFRQGRPLHLQIEHDPRHQFGLAYPFGHQGALHFDLQLHIPQLGGVHIPESRQHLYIIDFNVLQQIVPLSFCILGLVVYRPRPILGGLHEGLQSLFDEILGRPGRWWGIRHFFFVFFDSLHYR